MTYIYRLLEKKAVSVYIVTINNTTVFIMKKFSDNIFFSEKEFYSLTKYVIICSFSTSVTNMVYVTSKASQLERHNG